MPLLHAWIRKRRRHCSHLVRCCLTGRKTYGLSRSLCQRRERAFPEKVPVAIRGTTEPTSNILPQHFVAFSEMRQDKLLMRTNNIKTILFQKTLPFAKLSGNLDLQARKTASWECWIGPVVMRDGGRRARIQPSWSESQDNPISAAEATSKLCGHDKETW